MSSQSENLTNAQKVPRAVVHKKILDSAEANPNGSITELAETVIGASPDLVERVLDEYGDPATEQERSDEIAHETNADSAESATEPMGDDATIVTTKVAQTEVPDTEPTSPDTTDADTEAAQTEVPATELTDDDATTEVAQMEVSDTEPTDKDTTDANAEVARNEEPDKEEITEDQRAILRRIQEHPTKTQREIASGFEVSTSTINKRLNSIPGFDWGRRTELAAAMLDNNHSSQDEQIPDHATLSELTEQVQTLTEQVEALQNDRDSECDSDQSPFGDPDLACKIARECIRSEDITAEEEHQILKGLITSISSPQ